MKQTITIKAVTFNRAIQQIQFIKGYNVKSSIEFLKSFNIIELDDGFVMMGLDGNLVARPWNISEPRILTIEF